LTPQGGKGRAVREAMLRATGRVVAFTDADLPFDLTAIQQSYEMIRGGGCQLVFGARDLQKSKNLAPRRIARRLATFMFSQVVRHMISHEITDTQCGLKVFSREAALEIFSRTTIDGFAFDTEVILLTHRLGLSFQRVPVTLINEFGSTLSLSRHSLPMLMDVFRIWLRDRLGRSQPAPQFVFVETAAALKDNRKCFAA
jgi:dolichyl-phosphate beta-glucosyltransferase